MTPSEGSDFDPGSFRDRTGRVVISQGRVLRALDATAAAHWQRVSATQFFAAASAAGRVVSTAVTPPPAAASDPKWVMWLEHERIPFISYPYEWSFGMLQQAALLQLDLMQAALAEGCILKDATPFNVQFRGVSPVFIDVASFVPHDGGPWEGYRQFCQMFLYPLLLQAWRGIDIQPWLRGRLSGVTPAECWRLLSLRDLLRRGALSHVYLHAKLSEGTRTAQSNLPASLAASGFQKSLIEANIAKLRRLVERLQWQPRSSYWSEYDAGSEPVRLDGAAKEEIIRGVVAPRRWKFVWDLGCNVGRYSRIAADHVDYVLALDIDHLAVERMFVALQSEGRKNILPLVFNIADPSPGLGWRGVERQPLPARGRPELVFCLALVHHLVLRENLPLAEVIDWLAGLGGTLVIEFVDKADPQAQSLLAHRADQYDDYTAENFERLLTARYDVQARHALPSGTRTLYVAVPKA